MSIHVIKGDESTPSLSKNVSKEKKSRGFFGYFNVLIDTVDWFYKKASIRATFSFMMIVISLLCIGFNLMSPIIPMIMLAVSVPLFLLSGYLWLLISSIKEVSDFKNELSEIYTDYTSQAGGSVEIHRKTKILQRASLLAKFVIFARTSVDMSKNLGSVLFACVRLFSPFGLFLFLVSSIGMFFQLILLMLLLATLL